VDPARHRRRGPSREHAWNDGTELGRREIAQTVEQKLFHVGSVDTSVRARIEVCFFGSLKGSLNERVRDIEQLGELPVCPD
jgi:hypothetical protein